MADTTADTTHLKKPWILTITGAIGILILLLLPVLPLFKDAQTMPETAVWIGRFHPVFLHLPIGIFILILLQEIFGFMRKDKENGVGFPLTVGVFSSIAAVICGYMLWRSGDGSYGDIGERHLWGGTIFTCAVIATAIIKKWVLLNGWMVISYKIPLVASVGIMFFTSHDGGTMTHGKGFLTKEAPGPIKAILGIKHEDKDDDAGKTVADPVIYADVIHPIFERRCIACHKEGKTKGRLNMETFELVMKGGKEGEAITPGDAADSNIVYRMELPLDDEEHMPPEGKSQPEAAELAVIKWWIDAGASPDLKVADAEMPDEIAAIVGELIKMPAPSKGDDSKEPKGHGKPDKALAEQLAKITAKYPGTLTFESQESAGVVMSAVSLRSKLGDAEFAEFAPVIAHLVSADLSATSIGDSSAAQLKDASKLKMLRLGQTKITDNSADTLAALSELESLNLYGTEVTDALLAKLATLPKLKKLYLWQTKVTEEGVKKLKEALPECEVILGVE